MLITKDIKYAASHDVTLTCYVHIILDTTRLTIIYTTLLNWFKCTCWPTPTCSFPRSLYSFVFGCHGDSFNTIKMHPAFVLWGLCNTLTEYHDITRAHPFMENFLGSLVTDVHELPFAR